MGDKVIYGWVCIGGSGGDKVCVASGDGRELEVWVECGNWRWGDRGVDGGD